MTTPRRKSATQAPKYRVPRRFIKQLNAISATLRADQNRQIEATQAVAKDALAFWSRFKAAQKRIGSDRLAWLVDFSRNKDLSAPEDTGIEMLAFAAPEINRRSFDPYPPSEAVGYSPKQLADLARRISEGIADVMAGRLWRVGPLTLAREFRPKNAPTLLYSGKPADCFLATAVELIAAEFGRLKPCGWPQCGRPFVRQRRGLFCSVACSNKARFARWRLRHDLESKEKFRAYRREQYVQKIHDRQPGAVIRPRRSRRELAEDVLKASEKSEPREERKR